MLLPVAVAIAVAFAVAVAVFLGTKRTAGTWLLVAGAFVAIAGGVLWPLEHSHRHAVVVGGGSGITKSGEAYMELSRIVTTGHGPNHLPAFALFALGGAAALLGVLLNKRAPTNAGNDPSPSS